MQKVILGRPERIWAEFRDANGNLTNVSSPRVDIYDPSGTVVVDSASPSSDSTGIYYYLVSLSTASTTQEGKYSVWWSGTIGGVPIQQNDPKYFMGFRIPTGEGVGGDIIDDVRRMIGDNNSDNYHISDYDLRLYVSDGVDEIQRQYDMGYTLSISPTSMTFNKTLTSLARALFVRGTALIILEHLTHQNLWSIGNISTGDLTINNTNMNRERRVAVRDMRQEILRSIKNLYMMTNSGYSIDSYSDGVIETVGSYFRRYL